MTLDTFQRLFAYDAWGNRATLESIRLATLAPSSRGCTLVAHLVETGKISSGELKQMEKLIKERRTK